MAANSSNSSSCTHKAISASLRVNQTSIPSPFGVFISKIVFLNSAFATLAQVGFPQSKSTVYIGNLHQLLQL
ncbi:hypothetical protein CDL15_Pgr009824 [Punica granatum]|uniref:Uncharacterized protein n=1 Tax=Punica granatum TaxID=22663 RepID=A0A218WUI0_PUNGR|nr:hypothetical protein CDL15_Pgr009824 [Punica granatum]